VNPTSFAYDRVQTVEEAIDLLAKHGENAKLIAGGHSLLPIMKLRLAEPSHLIDIGRVSELRGVTEESGELVIGALSTHQDVATSPIVQARVPVLAAAASRIGDRQVRNRGTIGGALAHADPAADYPAAILALGGTMVARGPQGERRIPALEFFVDFLTTALAPEEVLTEVRFPALPDGHGWSYQKLANQASGYALVGVAAIVDLAGNGTAAEVRIGVTGTSSVPWRAQNVESALAGHTLDEERVTAAAQLVDTGVEPLDDLHGSADYRRRVTRGLAKRAILEAASRATPG
jgi:carbon-monoxide dehydrogenase medium subunit